MRTAIVQVRGYYRTHPWVGWVTAIAVTALLAYAGGSSWLWLVAILCLINLLLSPSVNQHLPVRWQRPLNDRRWRRLGIALLVVAALLRPTFVYVLGHHTALVDVSGPPERVMLNDGWAYRVYTRDHGVFEIRDSWWFLQFRSADLAADLRNHQGGRCTISYYGLRNGLLSWFPNIHHVSC